MQNQPYWDKTKREWILEYKVNDKDIGEYVQRVRFETLASANAYLQMFRKEIPIVFDDVYNKMVEEKQKQR